MLSAGLHTLFIGAVRLHQRERPEGRFSCPPLYIGRMPEVNINRPHYEPRPIPFVYEERTPLRDSSGDFYLDSAAAMCLQFGNYFGGVYLYHWNLDFLVGTLGGGLSVNVHSRSRSRRSLLDRSPVAVLECDSDARAVAQDQ